MKSTDITKKHEMKKTKKWISASVIIILMILILLPLSICIQRVIIESDYPDERGYEDIYLIFTIILFIIECFLGVALYSLLKKKQ